MIEDIYKETLREKRGDNWWKFMSNPNFHHPSDLTDWVYMHLSCPTEDFCYD